MFIEKDNNLELYDPVGVECCFLGNTFQKKNES
jgi:hypothetical protein